MKCNAHEGVYEQGKEAGEMIGIKISEEIKTNQSIASQVKDIRDKIYNR